MDELENLERLMSLAERLIALTERAQLSNEGYALQPARTAMNSKLADAIQAVNLNKE